MHTAAPDWLAQAEDILCPLCHYNLRGLSEARCPECGRPFEWADILDPERRHHPYVFEHHPNHNLWSLLRTLAGGLNPFRFWTELRPAQPSSPRRLIGYWVATHAVFLLLFVPLALPLFIEPAPPRFPSVMPPRFVGGYPGAYWPEPTLLDLLSKPFSTLGVCTAAYAAGLLAWPWLVFGAVMFLVDCVQHSHVRAIHFLRCVIYSSDISVLATILGILVMVNVRFVGDTKAKDAILSGLAAAAIAYLVLLLARLTIAFGRYLRLSSCLPLLLWAHLLIGLVFLAVAMLGSVWT